MRRKGREKRREKGKIWIICDTWNNRHCRVYIPRRVVCVGQLVNLSVGLSGVLNSAAVCCLLANWGLLCSPGRCVPVKRVFRVGMQVAPRALLTIIFTFSSALWKLLSSFCLENTLDKRKCWQLCLSWESLRKHFFLSVSLHVLCSIKKRGHCFGE